MVFLLGLRGLCFEWLLVRWRQNLPLFADQLGNLREGETLAPQLLSGFWVTINMYAPTKKCSFGSLLEKITYADGGLSGAFSSAYNEAEKSQWPTIALPDAAIQQKPQR